MIVTSQEHRHSKCKHKRPIIHNSLPPGRYIVQMTEVSSPKNTKRKVKSKKNTSDKWINDCILESIVRENRRLRNEKQVYNEYFNEFDHKYKELHEENYDLQRTVQYAARTKDLPIVIQRQRPVEIYHIEKYTEIERQKQFYPKQKSQTTACQSQYRTTKFQRNIV